MAQPRLIRYLEGGEYKYASVKDAGNLELLMTTDKSDLVSAINELYQNGGATPTQPSGISPETQAELDRLENENQDLNAQLGTAQTAINEVSTRTTSLETSEAQLRSDTDANLGEIQNQKDRQDQLESDLTTKLDSATYQTEYDQVRTDLQNKADLSAFNGVEGRVTTVETNVTNIEGEVSTKVSKTDFDGAVGVNKWVASRYPISGTDLSQTPPTFDLIRGMQASDVIEVDDGSSLPLFTGDHQITHFFTNVNMKTAKTLSLNVAHDDGLAIYVNGASVYSSKYNGTGTFPVSISLRVGWNTIEILHGQETGTPVLNLGSTISTQVDKLTSVIGIGNKNDTRLTKAETEIKQTTDAITLKADQTVVTSLGNRVTANESELSVQAGQIASKVAQSTFDAYSQKVDTQESTITQLSNEISSKVSQTDFDNLNGRVSSTETSITQLNNSITLKASQTDVNSLTGRVSTAETTITQNTNAIALKASQSSLDSLTGRVTSAESNITQNANAITTKVAQADFDTLNNRVGQTETSITQMSNSISLKANATDVYTKTEADGKTTTAVSDAKAEIKVTTDSISSTVSSLSTDVDGLQTTVDSHSTQIQQNSDEISLNVVKKDSIITSINASSEGVKITGEHIDFVGTVTINDLDQATRDRLNNSLDTTVQYNGVKIDASNGMVVTNSNNLVKTVVNAVDGFKIKKSSDGTNFTDVFWADTNGIVHANGLVIDNTSTIGGTSASTVVTYANNGNTASTTITSNKPTWDRSTNINSDGTFNTSKLNGQVADTQIVSASAWNSAKVNVDDMVSDLKVSALEKVQMSRDWEAIKAEYTQISAQASALAVDATAYTNSYNAFDGTTPKIATEVLATMTSSYTFASTTARDNFKAKFTTYYGEKEKLRKAISDKINTTATTANSTASTASTNANSALSSANTAISRLYDPTFEQGTSFWSSSYTGQTVSAISDALVTKVTGAGSSGGNVLQVAGKQLFGFSKNAIPIDVNRVYKMVFRVKQTADPTAGGSNVYAGVATLDGNFNGITGGAGTHRYFAVSGTSIKVVDGWKTYTGYITGTGDLANQFRAGTAYVRPMFLVNYSAGNGSAQIDEVTFEDVTDGYNAQKTATDASQSISDMASDMKLTPVEKQQLLVDWNAIQAEYNSLYNQAIALGIDILHQSDASIYDPNVYQTAFNNLNGVTPKINAEVLASMTTTYTFATTTDRDNWNTKINTYYTESQNIRKAITDQINSQINEPNTGVLDRLAIVESTTQEGIIVPMVMDSTAMTEIKASMATQDDLASYASSDDLMQTQTDLTVTMDDKIAQLGIDTLASTDQLNQTNNNLVGMLQSNAGNLLMNSVGFAGTDFWTTSGVVDSLSNDDIELHGSISAFSLNGGTISQDVNVVSQSYTISTVVKKGTAGTGYLKVYDGDIIQTATIDARAYDYEQISITITPTTNVVMVELNGDSASGGIWFTSTMMNVGDKPLPWRYASGESYSTSVKTNLNGIKVVSSAYDGYTAITPEGIEVYAEDDQGSLKKVSGQNKDVTEMTKASVDSEISMNPIKIIPINGGGNNGWAFIGS